MRIITDLHPQLQVKIKELQKLCDKNGLKIGIGECVRTVDEQNALYAQGRTTKGNIVTNTKGSTYSSLHQWRIAFDVYRNDGKGAYCDKDGFFTKVGKLGQSIGLEWGGSWKTICDKPHFQLPDWGSSATKLKQLYGTPDKFRKTWDKSDNTNQATNNSKEICPYKEPTKMVVFNSTGNNAKWVQWMLNVCGFTCKDDGKFYSASVSQLKKFQTKYKLDADGKVGNQTRTKLKEVYSKL